MQQVLCKSCHLMTDPEKMSLDGRGYCMACIISKAAAAREKLAKDLLPQRPRDFFFITGVDFDALPSAIIVPVFHHEKRTGWAANFSRDGERFCCDVWFDDCRPEDEVGYFRIMKLSGTDKIRIDGCLRRNAPESTWESMDCNYWIAGQSGGDRFQWFKNPAAEKVKPSGVSFRQAVASVTDEKCVDPPCDCDMPPGSTVVQTPDGDMMVLPPGVAYHKSPTCKYWYAYTVDGNRLEFGADTLAELMAMCPAIKKTVERMVEG